MNLPGRRLLDRLRVVSVTGLAFWLCGFAARPACAAEPGVAVLLVDTDRVAGRIDERIYGQFLEEINHSVVDGLYAEQVRGQGFEGEDFADYWTPFGTSGDATLVATAFERGEHSVRLSARVGTAGIRQGRVHVEAGQKYDGSLWLHPERGTPA
jgi:alpha-N-arabinofuranosidase